MKRLFALLVIAALFLAACGGEAPTTTQTGGQSGAQASAPTSAPQPTAIPQPTATPRPTATPKPTAVPQPAVGPEEQVKAFFADFSGALSDPNIKDQTTQDGWVKKLVAHAVPEQRAEVQTKMEQALSEFAKTDLGQLTGQGNLDARMTMAFSDLQTKVASQTATTAEVQIIDGKIKIDFVGKDADQLKKLMGTGFTQEMSIKDSQNGQAQNIKLQLVDGSWYILDLAKEDGLLGGTSSDTGSATSTP